MPDTEEVQTTPTEVETPEVEENTDPFADLEESEVTWDDGEDTEPATEEPEEAKEEPEEAPEEESVETEEAEEQDEKTQEEEPLQESEEPKAEDTTAADELTKDKAREAYKLREAERQLREEKENSKRLAEEQWVQQSQDNEELKARQDFINNERQTVRNANLVERELGVQVREAATELNLKNEPPEVQAAMAKSIDRFVALYTTTDSKGRTTGVKEGADVYQYLKEEADSIRALTGIGARKQSQQKAKLKQRTVARPTRTPKEPKPDTDLDAFDKEFNRQSQ